MELLQVLDEAPLVALQDAAHSGRLVGVGDEDLEHIECLEADEVAVVLHLQSIRQGRCIFVPRWIARMGIGLP